MRKWCRITGILLIRSTLGDIIMIVFFAVLGNADEWGEIESFAKRKEKWLRRYLSCHLGSRQMILTVW
ncbi:MAG: transposase family protein [Lachnospiraceae bacterium]